MNNQKAWEMAVKNQKLIGKVMAKSFGWIEFSNAMSYHDYYQAGLIGLFIAARKYDRKRGAFSTYAYAWIYQSISRLFRNEGFKSVRIPCYAYDRIGILKKQIRAGIDKPVKKNIQRAYQAQLPPVELDTLPANLFFADEIDPIINVHQNGLSELLEIVFKKRLTPIERDILKMHYGIGRKKALSINRIAELKHFSNQRISQIEKKAFEKIRDYIKAKKIKAEDCL